jgi:hypothetical protein
MKRPEDRQYFNIQTLAVLMTLVENNTTLDAYAKGVEGY